MQNKKVLPTPSGRNVRKIMKNVNLTLTSIMNIMTRAFCRLPNDLALFYGVKNIFLTLVAVGA